MISLMKRAIEMQLPDEPSPQDKHCQNTTSFCPLAIEYHDLEIPSLHDFATWYKIRQAGWQMEQWDIKKIKR